MSISESEKQKRRVRQSKRWKELKHIKNIEQKGKDPITLGKLSTKSNCHHLDLRLENYSNLEPDNFVLLNQKTHECVHFLYTYYRKDKNVIDRLVEILEKMFLINK